LAFLSLQVTKEEMFPGVFWTYVEEPRYYGPITLLCQLSFFLIAKEWLARLGPVPKTLFVFLAVCLCVEITRHVIFDFNRLRKIGKEEYRWQYEDRFQKYAGTVVTKAKALYPGAKIIVSGSSYYYNHRVSLYTHVPILYDPQPVFNATSIRTTKPVAVVNILNIKSPLPQQTAYMRNEKIAGNFDDFVFYITYVAPR
jgi:hypothetical protein